MEDFERFWKAYPRKMSKGAARRAWLKTENIRPSVDVLLRALIVARSSDQWRQDGGIYIPYPATWLNQEGWEDQHEIEVDAVKDEKAWHETVSGVLRMAEKVGLSWEEKLETFQQFAKRVRHAVDEKVTPIRKEMSI